MRLFAAITETIGVFWIYGLENLCLDVEFMLGIKTSFYWRICWAIVTPIMMVIVFIYALVTTDDLLFGDTYRYPQGAYIAGYVLQYTGIALIPIFMGLTFWKYRSDSWLETVKRSFRKSLLMDLKTLRSAKSGARSAQTRNTSARLSAKL
ncbi:sodium-dependent nutrient amino acid transporter 1-like, partial [Manduca sexta]|uniref:sodium-dependent nutrient amino acid transporter 1-like n=1 Tax=Manduca sexta TaxID=7130 RepID=UPI00188E6C23